MKDLFKEGFVYPSDTYGGKYVELEGTITAVGEALSTDADYPVTVATDQGEFRGFTSYTGGFPPQVGFHAQIRVYDAGGGWYPDNRVTGWRNKAPSNTAQQKKERP